MLLLNLLSLNALPILILAGGWLPAAHVLSITGRTRRSTASRPNVLFVARSLKSVYCFVFASARVLLVG